VELVGLFVEESGNAMLTSRASAGGVNFVISTSMGGCTVLVVVGRGRVTSKLLLEAADGRLLTVGVPVTELLSRDPGVTALVGIAGGETRQASVTGRVVAQLLLPFVARLG